jgi:hypothetical protein
MGVLHTVLCMLSSTMLLHNNVTMYKGGCLYPFSLLDSTLSNLELNSYLPALTILNVDYLPKGRELSAQGPLQYTSASSLK